LFRSQTDLDATISSSMAGIHQQGTSLRNL
jgi:hypothetical protein